MTILSKDPVREAFSGCSTGSNYYDSKVSAFYAFNAVLTDYGYKLDEEAWVDYNGDNGRANHPVLDGSGKEIGCAIFSWHRMLSGRYEFIGYLA